MRNPVAALSLALLAVPAFAGSPKPCTDTAYRQFDFWIGDWDVARPDGEAAGRNRIEAVLDGCALHESWTGASGFRGHSYSSYDSARGVWHQTWIDVAGTVLLIEGGLQDGAMVLQGVQSSPDGEQLNRITWTPQADGAVRQHWQVSADRGATWKTVFDGRYVRVDAASRATAR